MPAKDSGNVVKSFTVPAAWRSGSVPGQVPGQGGRQVERLLDMPKTKGGLAVLDHTEPRLSPESVVKGLGMPLEQEADWRGWLSRSIAGAPNEIVARQALYGKFVQEQTPPELRRALFQRAMNYYGGLRKAMVQVVTPDEILEKAEARGGSYYRRVPKAGGGFRYFYEPEKYHAREDAHVDGDTALRKRLAKTITSQVEAAGEKGCDHSTFKELAARFGSDKVAAALKEATGENGPLSFDKGLFRVKTAPKPALQKSERLILTR